MRAAATSHDAEIQRYLISGEHSTDFAGWPGTDFIDVARNGSATLREALIEEVRKRMASSELSMDLGWRDVQALTRTKVSPMVAGLFPRAEQAAVLAMLVRWYS